MAPLARPTIGALLLAGSAHAAGGTVSVAASKPRSCTAKLAPAGAPGVAQRRVAARGLGWFQATLDARSGDWDVAIFDARTRRLVGGSAGFRAHEVAGGKVTAGQRLVVQACRVRSSASRAQLSTQFDRLVQTKERLRMVRVAAPLGDEARRMQELGLDLTEHGGEGFVDVLLHGDRDEQLLRAAGFDFRVLVPDVNAAARRSLAERSTPSYGERQQLPSGRTAADGYRVLADYHADMKRLVAENPDLVRPITLPETTLSGSQVHAIEIAAGVARRDDGRPTFLMTGVHHAREWPSSEHAMEWAFELVEGYKSGNADVRRLVESSRTIILPIVNVDGFELSRGLVHEMKRKNCRAQTPALQIEQACSARPSNHGVDPNRNYSGLWGGVGASASFTNETFRGDDGFSEPETRNVQWLVSTRQVTGLITNHTYGRLTLRPPGVAAQGLAPDEDAMRELGARMTGHNGYANQFGWQLYDTNGTTEDWSYNATGGYGYTFEIGVTGFHQNYQVHVLDEYLGTGSVPGAGKGGNRAAYFAMMETVADPEHHGVLAGRTQAGRVLELTKSFQDAVGAGDRRGRRARRGARVRRPPAVLADRRPVALVRVARQPVHPARRPRRPLGARGRRADARLRPVPRDPDRHPGRRDLPGLPVHGHAGAGQRLHGGPHRLDQPGGERQRGAELGPRGLPQGGRRLHDAARQVDQLQPRAAVRGAAEHAHGRGRVRPARAQRALDRPRRLQRHRGVLRARAAGGAHAHLPRPEGRDPQGLAGVRRPRRARGARRSLQEVGGGRRRPCGTR